MQLLEGYLSDVAGMTSRLEFFHLTYAWGALRNFGGIPPDALQAAIEDSREQVRCLAVRMLRLATYMTWELQQAVVGLSQEEKDLHGPVPETLDCMVSSWHEYLMALVRPREVRFRRASEARRGRVWRYEPIDWKILARMRIVLPREISLLADPPPLGAEVAVPASELRRAVEAATELLASDASMVPTVFGLLIDEPVVERKDGIWNPPGLRASLDSEGWVTQVGNVLLEGDPEPWVGVTGGYDRCQLERRAASGAEEVRDLRGLKEFRTANWGVIRILSRPEEHSLTRTLRSMRSYLKACGDGEVLKSGR